ncbi:MAG: BON domain-containing protein [Calditrichaceae bacterium]
MRKGLVINVKSIINNLFPLNLVKILVFVFSFLLVTGNTFLYAQDKGLSDDEIEDAVETELWIDNVVNMNRIDIGVIDGVVTITGTVDNLLAKERAEKICESIVGVRAIINRIEVKPNERFSDKELESLVKDALLKDPATESYEISVETQNGIVTLNGKVDSWQEKQLAGAVAKGVNGVTAVNNRIDFTFAQNRSDQEIEKEIKAVLANDVLVDDNR